MFDLQFLFRVIHCHCYRYSYLFVGRSENNYRKYLHCFLLVIFLFLYRIFWLSRWNYKCSILRILNDILHGNTAACWLGLYPKEVFWVKINQRHGSNFYFSYDEKQLRFFQLKNKHAQTLISWLSSNHIVINESVIGNRCFYFENRLESSVRKQDKRTPTVNIFLLITSSVYYL